MEEVKAVLNQGQVTAFWRLSQNYTPSLVRGTDCCPVQGYCSTTPWGADDPCHTCFSAKKNAKSYSMNLVDHILSRHHEFGAARLTVDWFSCCCHSLNREYVMGLQAMIRMDDVQAYKTRLIWHICRTDGCSAKRQTRVASVGV